MKILFIYPQCPDSFWSFKHALKFVSKKAAVPPLGLITVSAMLPLIWEKKLVDMNVETLHISHIKWADYVFISAMYIQKESVSKVIAECKKLNKKIVAGGPLFTQEYESYPQIDHFVLNEAEITLPHFLADLAAGNPQRIYKTAEYADITQSPVPDYFLLACEKYVFMNLQVSRGCPFSCNFCEITSLLGHKVRMKTPDQILRELDALYQLNWRDSVFVVDDNFIGNKNEIKNHILPQMNQWMKEHRNPFSFNTQTSINLAHDKELMSLMVKTGFNSTFIGIETPEEQSLGSCNKIQNQNCDLLASVKKIQNAGLQVSGGFIVGFDSDTPSVFKRQIDFIQNSGIVSAMVGILNAPKNTKLYEQLETENRLTEAATGNNTDLTMNFIPKMDYSDLIKGYKEIIQNIYSIKPYYKRLRKMMENYHKQRIHRNNIKLNLILGLVKSIVIIGMVNKGRGEFWKLIFWTLLHQPASFVDVITFSVYGYHFRTIYGLKNKNTYKP
jgi:radical SAM superfamily enzyme YgiQ (UPF0313 family)